VYDKEVLRGDPGYNGRRGPPGELGEIGYQGPRGDSVGLLIMGEEGNRGLDGLKGPEGEYGIPGDIGYDGPPGDKGEQGDSFYGPPGEMGSKGYVGIPGDAGGRGLKGRPGTGGYDGIPVNIYFMIHFFSWMILKIYFRVEPVVKESVGTLVSTSSAVRQASQAFAVKKASVDWTDLQVWTEETGQRVNLDI
jgi:hypothetical protein